MPARKTTNSSRRRKAATKPEQPLTPSKVAEVLVIGLDAEHKIQRDGAHSWIFKVGGKTVAQVLARKTACRLNLKAAPPAKVLAAVGPEEVRDRGNRKPGGSGSLWAAGFQITQDTAPHARQVLEVALAAAAKEQS